MLYLKTLLTQAESFRKKRSSLAAELSGLKAEREAEEKALNDRWLADCSTIEKEKQSCLELGSKNYQKKLAYYSSMKNGVNKQKEAFSKYFSPASLQSYEPNPSRLDDTQLSELLEFLEEHGIIAWIKRLLRLGGRASRQEMGMELGRMLLDAEAYCAENINAISNQYHESNADVISEAKRKSQYMAQLLEQDRQKLYEKYKQLKEAALHRIGAFDSSEELHVLHTQLCSLRAEAAAFEGSWGSFKPLNTMPRRLPLCLTHITLPGKNGIDESMELPVWINNFESSLILIRPAAGMGDEAVEFARQILARMLRFLPGGDCSYTILDPLHKGSSLGPLISVTNCGSTELKFELSTQEKDSDRGASCSERRKFLSAQTTDIIKYMGGDYTSLYQYREINPLDREFAFSYFTQFNLPNDMSPQLYGEMKELLVNADTAGISFILVCDDEHEPESLMELIKNVYRGKSYIFNFSSGQLRLEDLVLPFSTALSPDTQQVGNFSRAICRYYEDSSHIDNKIYSIYSRQGLELKDSTCGLSIPFALDSQGELISMSLGGSDAVHGFITGGTNSGKTTLLHSVILSACLNYSPEDLEIWLVDYKSTEFNLYAAFPMPHVKVVAISKDEDFTFSLLEKIKKTAAQRSLMFNRFNAVNLQQYREHKGEPGYVPLTRILLIVDEFHVMSQHVLEDPVYKTDLENTVREYRAQGFTLLLSDQAISTGLSGLTETARNQIGLRIAMSNDKARTEIKATLNAERGLYTDSVEKAISLMSRGEFIMKTFMTNKDGSRFNSKLDKYKALLSTHEDIENISAAMCRFYGRCRNNELIYINPGERSGFNRSEIEAYNKTHELRSSSIRLYLGRSATMTPCFALDLGRQPNENLSVVGGTVYQRLELICAVMRSCALNNYKLLLFCAEDCDMMLDYEKELRELCAQLPGTQLLDSYELWCSKLKELEELCDARGNREDIVCIFVGLELAAGDLQSFGQSAKGPNAGFSQDFLSSLSRYCSEGENISQPEEKEESSSLFDATPVIKKLFEKGARNSIRCIAEVSVFRELRAGLRLSDYFRHRIAFAMSADDCLDYLGSSQYHSKIGENAIYSDGGKTVAKLVPYLLKSQEGLNEY